MLSKQDRDRRCRPKVTVEDKRARERAEANYRAIQAYALAPQFGIVPREADPAPVRVVRVKRSKPSRPPVNGKHRELYESLTKLRPGESYEWRDAPPRNVCHTLLCYWRQRLGLKVESFESSGRRFVRRA